ncbi:MAG: nitroreductase family protein [Prevotella sp.]|nr:nitroreductase family protein [Prevotella sp.]
MRSLLFSGMVVAAMTLASCENKAPEVKDTTVDNSELVLENIMTRTSIRAYEKDKPVEQEKVEKMLRAGMAAPTAVNKQPWHFVVLNERSVIDSLAAVNPNKEKMLQSPLIIVVCGDMTKAMEGDARQFWIQDTSAATENILLAAHAMGLGAVWTALYPNQERVKEAARVLGLPDQIIPLCAVVIGYPAENPEPKDKWQESNVSYNKFGQAK